MKKIKYKSILIFTSVLLLIISVIMIIFMAISDSVPFSVPPLEGADIPEITEGEVRTDTVLCYQREEDSALQLLNLSYRNSQYYFDEYPAQPLEEYGILPGDFAEISYQAEYSAGGIDGHHAVIKTLGNWRQIHAIEALSSRNLQAGEEIWQIARTATSYPIQVYQQEYADFVMIPAGDKYYLFLPDSDQPVIFDEYRKITKEIIISGEQKYLQTWVLCNNNLTDTEISDNLYQGKITDNPDLFFVGYQSPYPYSFTANGYEQESLYQMKKIFIPQTAPKPCADHFMAEQLENAEVFTALPEEVQQELVTGWNHTDDVLIFGGHYDEFTELTFDDNNRLHATDGNSSGYMLFYLESGFFEQICSGLDNSD